MFLSIYENWTSKRSFKWTRILEHGGRYNFKGKGSFEVVYLAPDPETAIAEGSRDKYLIPPSVLITIEVNLQRVIDLEDRETIHNAFFDRTFKEVQ